MIRSGVVASIIMLLCAAVVCFGEEEQAQNRTIPEARQGMTYEEYQALNENFFYQQNIPDTNFVNSVRIAVQGNGRTAKSGSRVELRFNGFLIRNGNKTEKREGTLKFSLGDGKVGPAIETVVGNVSAGSVLEVYMREEVAKGIREAWDSVLAGEQLFLEIELVKVE